ncbi:MAG: MBL fold metallo-hydrolase [Rhodothermaceae bacterium]
MKKIEISRNIYQYSFVSPDRSFSDNIFVILQNKKALIIDTAFEETALQVREDLEKQGISAETVIISHLHDDHIMGNCVFKDCKFYVHPIYNAQIEYRELIKKAFAECSDISFVENGMEIKYGDVSLKLFYAPGHHISGLTIVLNGTIVFANDLVIHSNDGKAALPYIDSGSTIDEHIASLAFLKELDPEILISGHGNMMVKNEIAEAIDERLFYLRKLNEFGGEAKIEDCLQNALTEYSHIGFHFSNLQKVFKRTL